MADTRVEEVLTGLFRAHDFDRMECQDHDGECDEAGCHDLVGADADQARHFARVVLEPDLNGGLLWLTPRLP